MSLDIRVLQESEVEAAHRLATLAFDNLDPERATRTIERGIARRETDWHLGAFENGEMTSMMTIIPAEMHINGGLVSLGAVSPVANSPLHRRKGHTGALMEYSLAVMRGRGQVLSGLYTPHPAFYRRYGWEIAAEETIFEVDPKNARLPAPPAERGRFSFIETDHWRRLHAVHAMHLARRNGPFQRDERWWRFGVLERNFFLPGPTQAVLWRSDAGDDEGYVVICFPEAPHRYAGCLLVAEMAALTPAAYKNLLLFLFSHDLVNKVVFRAAPDDPIRLHLADPERMDAHNNFSVMLRIVDVEAALRSRPAPAIGRDVRFALGVRDSSAAWNNGVFEVRCSGGSVQVTRVDSPADLTLDVRVLAPLYNGYMKPSAAEPTGLLEVSRPEALPDADAFFATTARPYFPDHF